MEALYLDHTDAQSNWQSAAVAAQSPFHTRELCAVVERAWPGEHTAYHVEQSTASGYAVIPAFLYKSCPRIDYYRNVIGADFAPDWPILVSHCLVGWYGFPLAFDMQSALGAFKEFSRRAMYFNATAMFAGVDERQTLTLKDLAEEGYHIGHFHTLMVRALSHADEDPVAALPPRYRRSRGQKLRQAASRGVSTRFATTSDSEAIIGLLTRGLQTKGMPANWLPENFLSELLLRRPPGLEILLALDERNIPIGVNVNFNWAGRYFVWLGSYDKETLPYCHQSDVLYAASISRAACLDCQEIQSGRTSYKTKLEFGYRPVRLMMAVKGHN